MSSDDAIPENPWRDDQVLLHGLTDIHRGLAAYLENILQVHHGTAEPLPARVVASLGTCMVEVGNALTGRVIDAVPKDLLSPPFRAGGDGGG
ncbi:hypothetical protein [Actinokineospora globicatena]|uniref:hypothetical protein n=1 Tax=Actinokineospora globicatena TaxID=103729 RepID=UPI0020A35FED|nr:hypothetical protein [Actinokineospora globicatena]GLW84703.1 hypothetical protein Aglo02_23430 [Actinokineospora globicatena]